MATGVILATFLLVGPALVYDQDPCLACAAPIHAAETLHHALPGDEIADHVVCVEIYPHLAGRCGDEENRLFTIGSVIADQTVSLQLMSSRLPLVHTAAADE